MVCFIGRYHVLAGLLALAAYLTVGVVIPMWNGKRGSQKGMEFRTSFGELNSFVLDSLRGLDETIQYGQGEKRKEQMSERSKELASVQENLSRMEGSQRSVTNMVILLASFGMLALTIYLYTKGGIGFEGVLTCTIAMMGSFGPVVALSSLSNNLNQTLASGERVLSLLEEAPLVEEIPGDAASGGDHAFAGAEAQNVTFAYEDETILDQYSLKLEPGKITGIHGASGSGKSTILSLICRNYEFQKGEILIDGIDIRKIKIDSLRKKFGQMLQDVFLFSGTIRSNIILREEGISDEEIMDVCHYVNADQFINKLDHGLDEPVRERGNNFSAGQRQLLSFARTIIHKPSVMILDEATANIDTETELLIQDSMEKMKNIGTMLIVAHRLSTIQHADEIIVLSHGKIVEHGTHQELLAAQGRYYQLYTLQYHREQSEKQRGRK